MAVGSSSPWPVKALRMGGYASAYAASESFLFLATAQVTYQKRAINPDPGFDLGVFRAHLLICVGASSSVTISHAAVTHTISENGLRPDRNVKWICFIYTRYFFSPLKKRQGISVVILIDPLVHYMTEPHKRFSLKYSSDSTSGKMGKKRMIRPPLRPTRLRWCVKIFFHDGEK